MCACVFTPVLMLNKCLISEELEALKNEPEQQETTGGETEVAATTAETEEKPDKKVATGHNIDHISIYPKLIKIF